MRTTKRRFEIFSFFDVDGIEKHLEKMAQKGWLISKMDMFGWVYKKIEPQKLKFNVCYYPNASEFDPEPSDKQKDFYEFCEHTGWKIACQSAQMQVFYNENLQAVPIETDAQITVETIHNAAKKNFLPSYFILLGLGLVQEFILISRFLNEPVELFSNSIYVLAGFLWFLVSIVYLAEIIGYFRWHSKAVKLAEDGEFLPPKGKTKLQKTMSYVVFAFLAFWLISAIFDEDKFLSYGAISIFISMMLLFVFINVIKHVLKDNKVKRNTNRAITLALCFILSFAITALFSAISIKLASNSNIDEKNNYIDKVPLVVSDLIDVNSDDYIAERTKSKSVFLEQLETWQYAKNKYEDLPYMRYEITFVKFEQLYNTCKNAMVNQKYKTYQKIDEKPWSANEAYQLFYDDGTNQNEYILCYNDKIIEIYFEWNPTEQQKQIVYQKIG